MTFNLKTLTQAFARLRDQARAFKAIRARRSFKLRSGLTCSTIAQPDWQLILVSVASAIAIGFLFLDNAAGIWKSSVSPELYHFFRKITELGKSEILLIPAGIAILALGLLPWSKLPKSLQAILCQFQILGLYVILAIAGSGLTNNLLKMLFGRARPRHFESLGPFHFDAPGLSSGFQSFPSGHSATAGAMAVIFILLFPRLKWIWLAITLWVAASRVIVGAHYPSDAVAGYAYGAIFAWLLATWFANRRLLFRTQNGVIHLPRWKPLSLRKLYKALHMMSQKA